MKLYCPLCGADLTEHDSIVVIETTYTHARIEIDRGAIPILTVDEEPYDSAGDLRYECLQCEAELHYIATTLQMLRPPIGRKKT